MQIRDINIRNYKGLQDIVFKPSSSTYIIGHNNSGKSSLLQAIHVALEGKTFPSDSFYDQAIPIDVSFSVTGCTDAQLRRMNTTHAEKIKPILRDNAIRLCYRQSLEDGTAFKYEELVPKDKNLRELPSSLAKTTKEERQALVDNLGKYSQYFPDVSSQKAVLAP